MEPNHQHDTKLSDIPQHSHFTFAQPKEHHIFFNSKFDSGNLSTVQRNSFEHYSIWTAPDASGTEHEGYPKSWFYFEVGGFRNRRVTFSVHRVHFLWALIKKNNIYRPVYRIHSNQSEENSNPPEISEWKRLPHPIISLDINSDEELVLKFDFVFFSNMKSVQFAFIYPYSHEQCHHHVLELKNKYELGKDPEIFFKQYELCRTYEGRVLDMLIISSHEGKQGFEFIKTDSIFTLGSSKLVKFRNNKPIIFISARVHPIETPSSFTMTGVINFLLDKDDYRAFLLRKYFVFVLVPMLNPDGVSNGHCRMDSLNQNLNRYYKNPDPVKQPSCYSIKKLCQHYNKEKRLFMYLDLHAHPAIKGNFIFGNAIFDYIEQVQSQIFPKILSQNCVNFEFQQCIFSRKHMKAKDKNEDISKEGCGRVVFYREFGLTHSYTLQCGYHCNTYNNVLQQEKSTSKGFIVRYKVNAKGQYIYDYDEELQLPADKAQLDEVVNEKIEKLKAKKSGNYQYRFMRHTRDELDNSNNPIYNKEISLYEPQTFYNLGRNICISILDIWNRNPYTRVVSANQDRKQIAEKQAKLDRFRKQQAGIKAKQKRIIQLIESQCYEEWHKRNVFQGQNLQQVKKTSLPNRFLQKSKGPQKSIVGEVTQTGTLSSQKIFIKNQPKSRKTIAKQEKKLNCVNPNIEAVKTITSLETAQVSLTIKSNLDSRNLFKPINMRIRNLSLANK